MSVTVLLSIAPPDGTTKYVDQLSEGKCDETRYKYFSWSTALFGRYQVFHVHWPEYLIRARNPRVGFVKRILFRLLLARLDMSNIAVVRTLHNLHPHESGDLHERRLTKRLEARTDLNIRLNGATPVGADDVTILHGHFIGRFPSVTPRQSEAGRILYFGLIRPYKGVERLMHVFQAIEDSSLSLRIVGNPKPELRPLVEDACATDCRITARLEYVPDDVLVSEIYRAELVVLPYKEMHNSGAILLALSLSRPVLAIRSAANELLAAEVGAGWLMLYDGDLTEGVLRWAMRQVRTENRSSAPQLSGRDWDVVGTQHHAAYLKALHKRSVLRRQERPIT